jgi:hypothetical protein
VNVKRIETVVHIDATPEQVWNVLTDFASYPQWSPRLTVVGRAEEGERLAVTAAAPGSNGMRFAPVVLAAEPGRVLRWRGKVLIRGLCAGTHEFVLRRTAAGTSVVHAEDFSGVLVALLGRSFQRIERDMHKQNDALRRRVASTLVRT